ncbi:pre-rRNA processing and 40S ribosomal subunit assembly [Saxophila tyrrhenica]|uniref:Pre-rRNA processing and 40S ribosomal subunit assembly n=1 Tax=Saxophila tyrrhenica TaxID=1690608 RepID=A0AAV9P6Q3_9PEZI|nr:pre-rRNA processing and 40S ribosomal subunit assembly [Saxophila tyrrhenica]
MAASSGKRKRDNSNDDSEDEGALRARFQKAFEAKFRPLDIKKPSPPPEPDEDDHEDDEESEASDWEGLSDDEREVEVIQHGSARSPDAMAIEREKKAFMSSRPPTSKDSSRREPPVKKDAVVEDTEEAANLQHDLALQRLLKESHLLDRNSSTAANTNVEGKGRLKALDLRLKDLGAKAPISAQEKMPLAHRKGITAKSADREGKRRREAADSGIVLEKAKFASKYSKPREKSVGGPTVGKFKGGTLSLGKSDLRAIQGPKRGGGGRRGGKR